MGILIAVPALLALAAGTFLRWGPRALRAAAAVTVALCYLQAAYLVQASFKEPIEALFVVAFAGTLYELELERGRSRSRLRFLPLGALAAGSVYVYSYTGVLWLAGTLVVWAAARLAANRALRRRVAGEARRQAGAAAIGVLGFLVLVSPEVPWMIRFAHSGYNRETTSVFGNLLHSLPPLEALGIWPRLDFRFDVPLGSAAGLLGLLALAALVGCVIRSLRRRGTSRSSHATTTYTAAKALAIVAPVVTLLLARELVVMLSSPRARSWSGLGAAALGGLLAVGAYSSFELLRDGPVAPPAHPAELSALRGVVGNRPTLFLGADDYVHWELRGVDLATPPAPLYTTLVVPLRRSKAQQDSAPSDPPSTEVTTDRFAGLRLAYDFDSVPPRVLDQFTFAIVPRTAYRSVPPLNWRLVETTRSYELWRRTGPTPSRQTLDEVDNPGAILDCRTAAGRQIATRRGVAMVLPAPVVGDSSAWRGAIGYAGKSAWQVLRLGAGRWDISLQYDSSVDLTVQNPAVTLCTNEITIGQAVPAA